MPVQMTPTVTVKDDRAERVVLCGCLKEPELVLPRLWDMGVETADFFHHCHGLLWDAVCETATTGDGEVGPHSLYLHLRKTDRLCELPSHRPAVWIAELCDADPTGAWAVPEAVRLIWFGRRRRAIHHANEVIRDAIDGVHDPEFYAAKAAELSGQPGRVA